MNRAPLLPLLALLTVGCGTPSSPMPTSPTPVSAVPPPAANGYVVAGIVTTTSGAGSRPIDGARITIITVMGRFEATSDDQGRYRLTVVASAVCEITVAKDGFATTRTGAQLSGDTVINFELHRS